MRAPMEAWKPKPSAAPKGGWAALRAEQQQRMGVEPEGEVEEDELFRVLQKVDGLPDENEKEAEWMREDALAMMKEALKPEVDEAWENGAELSLVSFCSSPPLTPRDTRTTSLMLLEIDCVRCNAALLVFIRGVDLRVYTLFLCSHDESCTRPPPSPPAWASTPPAWASTLVILSSFITLPVHQVLCGEKEIKKLNKEWLGKDYATDVLSFPMEGDEGLLGDIVISLPVAQRQV